MIKRIIKSAINIWHIVGSLAIVIYGIIIIRQNEDAENIIIYKWTIVQTFTMTINMIYCSLFLLYYLLVEELAEEKKEIFLTLPTYSLLMNITCWGISILSRYNLDQYKVEYYNLWLFFMINLWYDVICLIPMICYYIIFFICINYGKTKSYILYESNESTEIVA